MIRKISTPLFVAGMFCLTTFLSCKKDGTTMEVPTTKPNVEFYGLTNANSIIKYNANNLSTSISTLNIINLTMGESIMAIDFRPATGQLYALGNSSKVYTINLNTGTATAIGAAAFSPNLVGTMAGFDFNPTVDRIRVVSSSGQNLRVHPETGATAVEDVSINPSTVMVNSVAYTNNMAGATTTTLYDIADGKLYKQDPPNNGTLVEVGALGINATSESGFDIAPDNNLALAVLNDAGKSTVCQIDLTTGKATSLGSTTVTLIGLAIPTSPIAYAVDMSNNLQIFNFMKVGTPISKPITGLQVGETILGIDMRPATGQLYALGSSNRLYTINMASGAAAAVGTMPFSQPLLGTQFGFDFNPTVDRIRVVSNTGQNLRLNPIDGTVAVVDMPLNPGLPMIAAAAYANNYAGATSTTLYDIDYATNKLYKQIPPNDGTLVEIGNIGEDVDEHSGFDIGGHSNQAYATINSSSDAKIYMINTTTGQATKLSDYPNQILAFTVGLGF